MPKYMMTRGNRKKQPFCGFYYEEVNGVKIRRKVDIVFEEQKAVTTDADFSHWVKAGKLVCIDSKIEKSEDKKDEVIENDIDNQVEPIIDVEKENGDKSEIIDEDDDEDDGNDEDDETEDILDDIINNNSSYIEIDDGFKCVYCGKILKSRKRMISHVEKKHDEKNII